LQAFRGDVFAASLFTAYVLFEPVFTGIVPAFKNFITCREACPDPFRKNQLRYGICLRSPCATYEQKEVLLGRKRHY
jgi:hypothetical protein